MILLYIFCLKTCATPGFKQFHVRSPASGSPGCGSIYQPIAGEASGLLTSPLRCDIAVTDYKPYTLIITCSAVAWWRRLSGAGCKATVQRYSQLEWPRRRLRWM